MARKIGFIGIDKYDYILYLSRILFHLGKNVLLVDLSENRALTAAIPIPKGISGIIDYRGVKFLSFSAFPDDLGIYDVVLIDYGFGNKAELFPVSDCDFVVCVTDFQIHNVNSLKFNENIRNLNKCLVIKDITKSKIKPRFIIDELGFTNMDSQDVFLINIDFLDLACKIDCQYDDIFTFSKISSPVKIMLRQLIRKCVDDYSDNRFYNAYKRARKGD